MYIASLSYMDGSIEFVLGRRQIDYFRIYVGPRCVFKPISNFDFFDFFLRNVAPKLLLVRNAIRAMASCYLAIVCLFCKSMSIFFPS